MGLRGLRDTGSNSGLTNYQQALTSHLWTSVSFFFFFFLCVEMEIAVVVTSWITEMIKEYKVLRPVPGIQQALNEQELLTSELLK